MSGIQIAAVIGGMALAGTVGFIFGWLQGHVEAARQQTDRSLAQKQFNEARSKRVQTAQPGPRCLGMDCACGAGPCPADQPHRATAG
jgi:hypothetical protein